MTSQLKLKESHLTPLPFHSLGEDFFSALVIVIGADTSETPERLTLAFTLGSLSNAQKACTRSLSLWDSLNPFVLRLNKF